MFDYLFAVCLCFAILAAYNIGANDVSNSWATTVASRSLTLRQACFLAAIFEFLGAILVGARVAATIKTGIVSPEAFDNNPGIQMLAFTCALVAAGLWQMIATAKAWPVSSSYSIVSALMGAGVALDHKAVNWGWSGGTGLAVIWAGMAVAPLVAASFASIIYLFTKYAVLVRADSLRCGLWVSPVYFFTVSAVVTMSIVYRGSPTLNLDKLSKTTVAVAIVSTAFVVAVLAVCFWLPYTYAKVVRKDTTLRWFHVFQGPVLLRRRPASPPIDPVENSDHVTASAHAEGSREKTTDLEKATADASAGETGLTTESHELTGSSELPTVEVETASKSPQEPTVDAEEAASRKIKGPWVLPRNLWIIIRYKLPETLAHGTAVDVNEMAASGSDAAKIAEMQNLTQQFDNSTEELYSTLQVLTACAASFAHAGNDVGNAVAPLAVCYYAWQKNRVLEDDSSGTPSWILALGGICIVIGIFTFGYNLMAVMGNKLTTISPAKGFSMQFGSSITIILASLYGLPISTTMSITGATAGVGLVSGKAAVNWRSIRWIALGWVITIPVVSTASGLLTAIIAYGPHA